MFFVIKTKVCGKNLLDGILKGETLRDLLLCKLHKLLLGKLLDLIHVGHLRVKHRLYTKGKWGVSLLNMGGLDDGRNHKSCQNKKSIKPESFQSVQSVLIDKRKRLILERQDIVDRIEDNQ